MFLEHLIKLYCFANGIILNEKYRKYEIYLFSATMTNSSILIFGLLHGCWRASTIIFKMQIFSVFLCVFSVFLFKVLARIHKKRVINIISNMSKDSNFSSTGILEKVNLKMETIFLSLLAIMFGTFFALFNATFLYFLSKTEINYNDPDFYVIPYMFKYFDINSFKGYLAFVWLQTALLFPEMIAYTSLCIFMCYVVASLKVSVDEFNSYASNAIFSISRVATMSSKKNAKNQFKKQEDIGKIFKDLIIFQQYIYSYLNDFLQFVKWIFNIMLVWFFMTLVMFGFVLAQIENDKVLKLKLFVVVTNLGSVFYLSCYIGELLCELNEEMLMSFYNTPWTHLHHYHRKSLIQFMLQSHYEIQIKAFNMYNFDMKLYMKTLKIIYSAVNAIRMAQQK